ncbi:hypothetical protein GCM10011365_25760 [Marinicella pacifica]|uniref:Phage integrase family protein n=1 Tax=Marinicella pacifica TaxID=1171543 RepID=A0A917CZF9_9GAMM|nr:hypothetical protein [Marinicella pacifica]GGG03465.1 hypothetical protein GCM10011365_25760 [Marinicella pacifica]
MTKLKKLARSPLKIKKTDKTKSANRVFEWMVVVENGGKVDVSDLKKLHDGENIFNELLFFLKAQRKKRVYLYCILRYLRFVISINKKVNATTLKLYKAELDHVTSKEANSKAQEFSICISFLKQLMSVEVILRDRLPENFKYTAKKHKESFYSLCCKNENELKEVLAPFGEDISSLSKKYGLDLIEAANCFYSDRCLDIIHKKSIADIKSGLNDVEFVDNIISGTSMSEIEKFKKISNFSEIYSFKRTVEEAVAILYSHYGYSLPRVDDWIPGVYDALKSRGWKSDKIKKELKDAKTKKGEFYTIIKNLSDREIETYKKIKDWRIKSFKKKSVEDCFKILYSKYGYFLPLASKWPFGLADYLKSRGWNCTRVYSAFFPDKRIHMPLLIAFLSHKEIAPNVDSIFYHTYFNSIQKDSERGYCLLNMNKMRGNSVGIPIKLSDPLIASTLKLIKIYQERLMGCDVGRDLLKKNNNSIFLNLMRIKKYIKQENDLRLYDPGTASDWVRRSLSNYSNEEPLLKPLVTSLVSGENFRPTHALLTKLKGGEFAKIKKLLGHSKTSTTKNYVERSETLGLLNKKNIEFQKLLLNEIAVNTRANKIGSTSKPKDKLLQIDYEQRLALKTPELEAEWIAYHDSILKDKNRLMFENPYRWNNYWALRLAEYQVLISQLDSKSLQVAKQNAKKIDLPILN